MESRTGSSVESLLSGRNPAESSMKLHRRKQVIENRSALFYMDRSALWEYRELLHILVWRDIKVRYKQTAIGVSWVVLQPLVTMFRSTWNGTRSGLAGNHECAASRGAIDSLITNHV